MNKEYSITSLNSDRKDIIEILKPFQIEILKLEMKDYNYIIWLGGINKLLYKKYKVEIETALAKHFSARVYLNRNIKFIIR